MYKQLIITALLSISLHAIGSESSIESSNAGNQQIPQFNPFLTNVTGIETFYPIDDDQTNPQHPSESLNIITVVVKRLAVGIVASGGIFGTAAFTFLGYKNLALITAALSISTVSGIFNGHKIYKSCKKESTLSI